MPIVASFPEGVIEIRASGVVTVDDLASVVESARGKVTESCPPLLVDARDVKSAPDLAEIRRVLKSAQEIPGIDKCRIALVTQNDWVFGVGRAISAYASFVGMAFEIFRDELAAREWLGAPSD